MCTIGSDNIHPRNNIFETIIERGFSCRFTHLERLFMNVRTNSYTMYIYLKRYVVLAITS